MWHSMQPTVAGKPLSAFSHEGCMWGMGAYPYFFASKAEYDFNRSPSKAIVQFSSLPKKIHAGVPVNLVASIKNADDTPARLFMDMDKLLHVVIISRDETVFAHIHPDDLAPLSQNAIDSSTFTTRYAFPKAGTYLLSFDYAHGMQLESKQLIVDVAGSLQQSQKIASYASPGDFDGYTASLKYSLPLAGQVSTLYYTIEKNGKPVTDIVPYLSAVAHISVVKNDLSAFIHTHGEVHPPGVAIPPMIVKNGQVIHSMAMMMTPSRFGPDIEAHLIFPSAGEYTVWAEFKVGNKVIPTAFTIKVEQ